MVMKLYATSASTTDAIASLDCPEEGLITGALVSMHGTGLGDASVGRFEVSFASTGGFASNDTRASFVGGAISYEFTTSGGSMASQCFYVPLNEPVAPGERIYLHFVCTSITLLVSCWLYTDYKSAKTSERRRR